jgi:hypothetical protein
MADDLTQVGKGDRIRVSLQKHEAQFLAKKFKVSAQQAAGAIRATGPSRKRVEDYIREKKKNGGYR